MEDLNKANEIHENYIANMDKGYICSTAEESLSRFEVYKETFKEAFWNVESAVNKIDEIIKGGKHIIEDPNIFNLINDFKKYLNSLSAMELCLVINITTSIFILSCIISILYAVGGNYLINKFSLIEKLPKLKKIILLRVKFQRYYIYLDSLLIILAVLSLILVNFITLLYG